jgi:hypothetical protein
MGKVQGCKTLKVGSKEEKAKAETPHGIVVAIT